MKAHIRSSKKISNQEEKAMNNTSSKTVMNTNNSMEEPTMSNDNNSNETDNKVIGDADANDVTTAHKENINSEYESGIIPAKDFLDHDKGISFIKNNLSEECRYSSSSTRLNFFYIIIGDLLVKSSPFEYGSTMVFGNMGPEYSNVKFDLNSDKDKNDEFIQKGLTTAATEIYSRMLFGTFDFVRFMITPCDY